MKENFKCGMNDRIALRIYGPEMVAAVLLGAVKQFQSKP